jgi:hypothetical protein
MDIESLAALRRQSGLFAKFTLVLALALVAGIATCLASLPLRSGGDPDWLMGLHLLYWFPSLFYLWVLVAVRRTFADVAKGALFGPAVARGLRHLGWALIVGGILNTALAPLLQTARLPSGFADGRTLIFGFDSAYLVLSLVGAAVLLLARLIRTAADYQAKNEALEAELDEFL